MIKTLLFSVIALTLSFTAWGKSHSYDAMTSPNGNLTVTLSHDADGLRYSIHYAGLQALAPSRMGMELTSGRILGKGVGSLKAKRGLRIIGTDTPFYRKARIEERCNTYSYSFGDYGLEFAVFDHGAAYRWVTRFTADSITVKRELTEFVLPGDCTVAYTECNNDSEDLSRQVLNSFERPYLASPVSRMNPRRLAQGAVLVTLMGNKRMLISDYNTLDYPEMMLLPDELSLKSHFAPYPEVEEVGGYHNMQWIVKRQAPFIARTAGKRTFPWRMALIFDNDGQIPECDIPYCLAEPSRIADTSWIKPGLAAWDWWNAWNLRGVDFKAGINTRTYMHYIDFAAHYGIPYVILDEGWAVEGEWDLMQVVPEIDLEQLVEYGCRRGVRLILWAGHTAMSRDMEAVCAHYAKMGIAGFKIDYFERNDQRVMRFIEQAAEVCARHHLIIDYHGISSPHGLTVTYPNVLNFEGVHGMEQLKWSPPSTDQVSHEMMLPFTRAVLGPMDYTQGAMLNAAKGLYYPRYSKPMSQGTRVRQMAQYVIFDAPLAMLCDSPSNYTDNDECTRFIASTPTTWDETRILHARLGQAIVEARRKGNDWWIAAIGDWEARDITLDLSWLSGREMLTFADGVNAEKEAEDYRVRSTPVPAKLQIHLAPGGGFVAKVTN